LIGVGDRLEVVLYFLSCADPSLSGLSHRPVTGTHRGVLAIETAQNKKNEHHNNSNNKKQVKRYSIRQWQKKWQSLLRMPMLLPSDRDPQLSSVSTTLSTHYNDSATDSTQHVVSKREVSREYLISFVSER
jgi:hypothetical protein